MDPWPVDERLIPSTVYEDFFDLPSNQMIMLSSQMAQGINHRGQRWYATSCSPRHDGDFGDRTGPEVPFSMTGWSQLLTDRVN